MENFINQNTHKYLQISHDDKHFEEFIVKTLKKFLEYLQCVINISKFHL